MRHLDGLPVAEGALPPDGSVQFPLEGKEDYGEGGAAAEAHPNRDGHVLVTTQIRSFKLFNYRLLKGSMHEVRALILYKFRAHAPMCEIHGAVDGVHNPRGLLGNSFNLFSVGLFADEAMMGVLLSGKQFPIFQNKL